MAAANAAGGYAPPGGPPGQSGYVCLSISSLEARWPSTTPSLIQPQPGQQQYQAYPGGAAVSQTLFLLLVTRPLVIVIGPVPRQGPAASDACAFITTTTPPPGGPRLSPATLP